MEQKDLVVGKKYRLNHDLRRWEDSDEEEDSELLIAKGEVVEYVEEGDSDSFGQTALVEMENGEAWFINPKFLEEVE